MDSDLVRVGGRESKGRGLQQVLPCHQSAGGGGRAGDLPPSASAAARNPMDKACPVL